MFGCRHQGQSPITEKCRHLFYSRMCSVYTHGPFLETDQYITPLYPPPQRGLTQVMGGRKLDSVTEFRYLC